ncbi:MAG: hypothetical protein ACREUU_18510 [Gammaproteobacteria bacterium]
MAAKTAATETAAVLRVRLHAGAKARLYALVPTPRTPTSAAPIYSYVRRL